LVAVFQREGQVQKEMGSDNYAGRLVTILDPTSSASEAYRTLRTSLLYAPVDNSPTTIVITSPGLAEGKSTVCANLGVVLAQAEKRTLIVDCDLRSPTVHEIFGLPSSPGMVDVLAGAHELQDSYQEPLPDLDLRVLTAGVPPSNPTELLSSPRVTKFFTSVREEFDYVLVDSPPTELVSDPLILAVQGDGVLLTLNTKKTSKNELQQAMRSLRMVGAHVLGTVINNAEK
jgi:capsular exopolysaccharide synthesis family protein